MATNGITLWLQRAVLKALEKGILTRPSIPQSGAECSYNGSSWLISVPDTGKLQILDVSKAAAEWVEIQSALV